MEIVKTQNLEKLNQNIKDDFFKVPNLKFDIDKLKTDLNIVLKKKKFNTLGIKNFGAIFSIDLTDGIDCFKVLDRMEHIVSSSNLGDTRTLAIPVAHTIYFEMGTERRSSMGISDSMIRFSVGIEELEDLVSDLKTALS